MKLIVVTSRSRTEVELKEDATLDDLKKAYKPKVSIHRKSFKIAPPHQDNETSSTKANENRAKNGKKSTPKLISLADKGTLQDQGVKDNTEVFYKDLGPQIGYRTVFIIEYLGPILFMLAYASQPRIIYGDSLKDAKPFSLTQKIFISLFLFHFVKRELETLFVHKFSRPTMPLLNIFKNCIYYYSFAAFIGYILCHPHYTDPVTTIEKTNSDNSSPIAAFLAYKVYFDAVLMLLCEIYNFSVHLQLSRMRNKDGETTRNVPSGYLFQFVSCPNYFFEVLSWLFFSLGTAIFVSYIFTFVGLVQMTEWALKKHAGYIKIDPNQKRKKAIIPFII